MNKFDTYIAEYLFENKEVALDKIGIIKTTASSPSHDADIPVNFLPDKKASTSESLIKYIAEKTGKNKYLVLSDIESHLSQVREFINIGKTYEIPDLGFIKANKAGVYEFLPYSEAVRPVRINTQPATRSGRNNSRGVVQVISFVIVIAILAGIGWQVYQFSKKNNNTATAITNTADTSANNVLQDTSKKTDSAAPAQATAFAASDSVNVRYIFETTASRLRARTRTAQLQTFGNNAGFDSFVNHDATFYSLYIIKPTRLADTAAVKDSFAKFFLKDIKLEIAPSAR